MVDPYFENACKLFIREVLSMAASKNRPVTAREVGEKAFGGEPNVMLQSTVQIVGICRDEQLVTCSIDLGEVYVTDKGLRFIH